MGYSQDTIGVLIVLGQARVVFVEMGLKRCHILLLDEPTNHHDLETIDCLTEVLTSTLHRGSNVLSWLLTGHS